MRVVRLFNNKVIEILPESVNEKGVAHWYNENFARQCVTTQFDEVKQGMEYSSENDTFFWPEPKPEEKIETVETLRADIDYIAIMSDIDLEV